MCGHVRTGPPNLANFDPDTGTLKIDDKLYQVVGVGVVWMSGQVEGCGYDASGDCSPAQWQQGG